MRNRKTLVATAIVLLVAYVTLYLWLSRRGYTEAEQFRMAGFYYFSPEPTDAWRLKNYGCTLLFWPLNAVDRSLGSGRQPASEPLWGLSK